MDISSELINWYLINKRSLPWRETTDPYTIWLSEIILQQTRVEQGLPYFYIFLEKYPSVKDFAKASEDDILKLWQGLGYYSRGRNMLKTAKEINDNLGGNFPVRYCDLIKLKGIGEYTAAAISSFATNEERAVVDGNVFRVLSRFFGVDEPINSQKGKKLFQNIANQILNKDHSGVHNQAMMEFGALHCRAQKPLCSTCPISLNCHALKNNAITSLLVKIKKVKLKERFFTYLLVIRDDHILMNKRGNGDIWANLFELPLIETPNELSAPELLILPEFMQQFGNDTTVEHFGDTHKHLLTHQKLFVKIIHIKTNSIAFNNEWFFVPIKRLNELALPKIVDLLLRQLIAF